MNIAFISSGNSIHVKKIANALVERGHSITLYTLPDYNKLLDDFDHRVKIVKLPVAGKKGYYLNVPFLKKQLLKGHYDLINAHYASGCGTMARLTGVHPFALAVFGADVYDYPFISKANMKRVVKNLDAADVLTSTSKVMVDKIHEYYPSNKPIYVTPFGVDINRFHPCKVDKDKNTFEFGIVKKIEHKYGIGLLLKAFKMFRDELPEINCNLVIYGRGSALNEYKEMANSIGLDDDSIFKGFIQNELVPNVLSHMDVACFPSVLDSESFGVAAVEAMACGTPVIASDASGFTEVVKDGVTGIIVKKNDVNELKNAMKKIYAMSSEERHAMGEAGIERVKQLYDFSDNIDTYINAITCALK